MAKLEFESAPAELEGRSYKFYREWLNFNFYDQLCAYCLLSFPDSLQIDHYEPQKYAPSKINDPKNLLLACRICNRGKSDYHPNHSSRVKCKKENHGFSVIDIRNENFSDLFMLKENGELGAKAGSQRDRVKFNIISLFRLNIKSYKNRRLDCLDYVKCTEGLLAATDESEQAKKYLKILVKLCAERYSFLKAFDIILTDALVKLIQEYFVENRRV